MVRMLGIDPGTKCGYAWLDIPSPVPPALAPLRTQCGVWDLSVKRHEGGGMRFLRFRKYLEELDPQFIVYEEVRRHKGVSAAHVYGGLIAILQEFCEVKGIQHIGIPVATIKRRATGKGNAKKEDMILAANATFKGSEEPIEDDNAADAMWILQIGVEEYGGVLKEGGGV